MSIRTRDKMIGFFDEKILASTKKYAMLIAEHRDDEANFERIRSNVFDIFKTIFAVAVKTFGEDDDKMYQFFQSKLEQVPSNWKTSHSKAREHDDYEKIRIEEIKLDTVTEIKAAFEEMWG